VCVCARARGRAQIFVVRSKFHDSPYNIPGTCSFCPLMLEDAICAFLCGWCAVQQIQRHMCTVSTPGPAYLFAPDSTNTMNSAAAADKAN